MRIETLAVEPRQFAALIDELRFRYHKWDAYVSGMLRILPEPSSSHLKNTEEAVACCVRIHAVLRKAAARVLEEPRWLARLGIPGCARDHSR